MARREAKILASGDDAVNKMSADSEMAFLVCEMVRTDSSRLIDCKKCGSFFRVVPLRHPMDLSGLHIDELGLKAHMSALSAAHRDRKDLHELGIVAGLNEIIGVESDLHIVAREAVEILEWHEVDKILAALVFDALLFRVKHADPGRDRSEDLVVDRVASNSDLEVIALRDYSREDFVAEIGEAPCEARIVVLVMEADDECYFHDFF